MKYSQPLYKYGKKNPPCPLCGDVKQGNCASPPDSIDQVVFCHGFSSADQEETRKLGWRYVRDIIGGPPSAKFVRIGYGSGGSGSYTPRAKFQPWKSGTDRGRIQFEKQVAELETLLSNTNRSDLYKQYVLPIFEFTKDCRQVLKERGLTPDQIEYAKTVGFVDWQPHKSVVGVQDLGEDTKQSLSNLAGINSVGTRTIGTAGMAVPAIDPNGNITGFQIKPWGKRGAKYIWNTNQEDGKAVPRLRTSELPLFTWKHPDCADVKEVWLVEGALKSFLCASFLWAQKSKDIAVIGAPGVTTFGKNTLLNYLEILNPEKIVVAPDGNTNKNKQVTDAITRLLGILRRWHWPIEVADWNQNKYGLDLDEILVQGHISFDRLKVGQRVGYDYLGADVRIGRIPERNAPKSVRFAGNLMAVYLHAFKDGKQLDFYQTYGWAATSTLVSQIDKIRLVPVNDMLAGVDRRMDSEAAERVRSLLNEGLHTEKGRLQRLPYKTSYPLSMPEKFLAALRRDWYEGENGYTYDDSGEPLFVEGSMAPKKYQAEKRKDIWSALVSEPELRKKYVFDSSPTGTGKSHTAGEMRLEDWNRHSQYVDTVVYLTTDPQNVAVKTLQGGEWKVLRGRDDGRKLVPVIDSDGRETNQLRRIKKGEKDQAFLHGNCSRVRLQEVLIKKNIPPTSTNICDGCIHKKVCPFTEGPGFGFISQRSNTLASSYVIAHPSSIADVISDPENKKSYVLVVDEASQLEWFQSLTISRDEIAKTLGNISTRLSRGLVEGDFVAGDPQVVELQHLVDIIGTLVEEKSMHGFMHTDLRKKFAAIAEGLKIDIPQLDVEFLERMSQQDLSKLDEWREYQIEDGGDQELKRIGRNVQAIVTDGDRLAQEMEASLSTRWIGDFYQAMVDEKFGYELRVGYHNCTGISFKRLNQAYIDMFRSDRVSTVLFLDATEGPEFFTDILRLDQPIHWIEAESLENQEQKRDDSVPLTDWQQQVETYRAFGGNARTIPNLRVVQVVGRGLVGSQRSDALQADVKKIVNKIKELGKDRGIEIPVITQKQFADKGQGFFHVHSRGSNAYQTAQELILEGLPCPNIRDLTDEYALIHGYDPGSDTVDRVYPINGVHERPGHVYYARSLNEARDENLALFIRKRILNVYHQAFGRLRYNRRPNEELTIYLVSEYPIDLAVEVLEYTNLLGVPGRAEEQIRREIAHRLLGNTKCTTRSIAEAVGVSSSYVGRSRAWREFQEFNWLWFGLSTSPSIPYSAGSQSKPQVELANLSPRKMAEVVSQWTFQPANIEPPKPPDPPDPEEAEDIPVVRVRLTPGKVRAGIAPGESHYTQPCYLPERSYNLFRKRARQREKK